MLTAAGPAVAEFDEAAVAPAPSWDPETEAGWCEIRLEADASAALRLDNTQATLSTETGSVCAIRQAVCNAPIQAGAGDFRVTRVEGYGRIELLWPPTARNGWKATIRVYDAKPGADAYTLRLEWSRRKLAEGLPGDITSGLDNDELLARRLLQFDGAGKGSFEGAEAPGIDLASATIRTDAAGTVAGAFAGAGGERLEFRGHVTSATRFQMVTTFEMTGTPIRRGSMTIERDRRGGLKRIFVQGIENGRRFTIRFAS
jgi:hypothetical protein